MKKKKEPYILAWCDNCQKKTGLKNLQRDLHIRDNGVKKMLISGNCFVCGKFISFFAKDEPRSDDDPLKTLFLVILVTLIIVAIVFFFRAFVHWITY